MKHHRITFSCFILLISVSGLSGQVMKLSEPQPGKVWCQGGKYTIKWTKSGGGLMPAKVRLELFNSTGTVKVMDIINETANDGSFQWVVPLYAIPGNYRIRIKALGTPVYDFSSVFMIGDCPGGVIKISSPRAGEQWGIGRTSTISWVINGAMHPQVKIMLYNSSGTVKMMAVTPQTDNDGSYQWLVPPSVPLGSYRIKVVSLDDEVSDLSEVFTVGDCPAGGIVIGIPRAGDHWEKRKSYLIRWEISLENRMQHPQVEIGLYNSEGTLKILNITSTAENNGSFNWLIPGTVRPGTYRIRVKTTDQQACDESEIFNIREGH